MQKRIVSVLLTLTLVASLIGSCLSVSADGYNFKSGKDIVNYINRYIRNYYNTDHDYYPERFEGRNINYAQVWKEWTRNSNGKGSYLLNPVVYGNSHVVKYTQVWSGYTSNAIGYDKFGNSIIPYTENFVNPYDGFFRWDSGWTGHYLNNVSATYWQPYNSTCSNRTASEKKAIKETRYSGSFIPDATLMEKAIQKGVDYIWSDVPASKVTTSKYYKGTYIYDRVIHKKGQKPANGNWVDYLLIVVPPTDISWGLAWRFNGSGNSWFIIDIPIAPFNMVNEVDIVTNYEEYIGSAAAGQKVSFVAGVEAEESLSGVSYSWSIKDINGNPVSGVSYSGYSSGASGSFNITKNRTARHKATFTMPNTDVIVSFVANGDKKIAEMDYSNNSAIIDPVTIKVQKEGPATNVGEFELDYDIYARKVSFDLGEVTADFPKGLNYTGNGKASFNASTNNVALKYSSVSGNTTVNTAPFKTTPEVSTIIYREGLGDKPLQRVWLPNGEYSSTELIRLNGNAWRNYLYSYTTAKGTSKSVEVKHYESFQPKKGEITAKIKVYNGMPTLNSHAINSNIASSHIEWKSDAIPFNVNREMFLLDENGNRVSKANMPGQYTRTFYGTNKADIVWVAEKSLASSYAQDRATAKNRGSNYNLAVFSTGKDFANVDYPIKSGYMFNPAATYVCRVKSSVYCNKNASEEEKNKVHNELVDKVIRSFVYNNELTYTKNGNDTYYLKNITNANPGNILKITPQKNSNVAGIANSEFEPFMEGYASSGTLSSYENYHYREYVATSTVNRVDAETVIRFTISSPSKRYTNIRMADGSYKITAKSNSFEFQNMTVPANSLSDEITVKVKGSLYDDRN